MDTDINHIRATLRYALENSQFYRDKYLEFDKHIFNDDTIFKRLPLTTKGELLKDQETNPPFGSNLCVDRLSIQRIHKTSGTTSSPLILALTKEDVEITVRAGAACFSLAGLTANDLVIHCLNYCMWAGGYTDHQSLEETGAGVIPFGVGNTKELINTILRIRPSAIHCTPSYLRKIEFVLKNEFDLMPEDLHLTLGLFGGEPGLQNREFRNHIERTWGIKAMNANYGLSDVLSIFASECYCQESLHFLGGNLLHPEILDNSLCEFVPIEKGVTGELILTNLRKQAQPLIRYRTNDILNIRSLERCRCGQDAFRFDILGRSDDMIVYKGINLFLSAIEKLLGSYLDLLSGQYQVHINREDPVDRMLLKLELNDHTDIVSVNKEFFVREFVEKLIIKPEISFEPYGRLSRTEGKSRRLFRDL